MQRIPMHLLAEWMAFYSIEPFGYDADMMGHAITSAVVANVNRQKGKRPYKVEDFLPKARNSARGDDVFGALRDWAVMHGARRVKRG